MESHGNDASIKDLRYSFLKVLTGSDLSTRRLALMEAESINPGPVVWLTACIHGDEVGGIVVIQEIFKRLKKFPLLKGKINAFPLMNTIGFEMVSRHIGLNREDLNRSFPGNASGSLAERIAHRIFTTIIQTEPTIVIDLHNDWIKSIPHILIDPHPGKDYEDVIEKVREFCKMSGFLMVNEDGAGIDPRIIRKTLTGSFILRHIPAITIELGEAFVVNEQNVQDGVIAIWNILTSMQMTNPIQQKLNHHIPDITKNKILTYSHQPTSSSSGIIRFLVKHGQIIKKDQKIAKIHNVFGKLQETLVAQEDGIVLGHSDSSVALPGAPIAAFGIIKK